MLEALSGSANPAAAGNHTYTSSGLVLAPSTSYWIVAGVTAGAGDYTWNMTNSNSYTGSWSIPSTATHIYSFDLGSNWESAADGFPRKFSISASAIPESSTTAALLATAAIGAAVWWRRRERAGC
jgi:hypothetical protein